MSGKQKQLKKEVAFEKKQERKQERREEAEEETAQYPPVAQVITSIFKTIALDETDIERLRQELANVRDFDSRNLYDRLNANGDERVTADELCAYMTDNGVKGATIENCSEIISEFDSSGDGSMQYEEFLNMVLPAANLRLREQCLYGRRVYLNPSSPLPQDIISAAVRIFEKEKQLIDRKKDLQLQLASNPDYNRQDAFDEASVGQTFISTLMLTQYLEKNGFYPRESDLEAILRRCDHSGDKEMSYTEFCEATEILIPGQSSEQQEESRKEKSGKKDQSQSNEKPRWQIVEDERRAAEEERRNQWMQDEEDKRQSRLQETEDRRASEEARREVEKRDFEARVEAEKQRREEELEADRQKREEQLEASRQRAEEQRREWEEAQEKRRLEAEDRRASDEARREVEKRDFEARVEAEKQRLDEEREVQRQKAEEQRREWEEAQEKRRQEDDARMEARKQEDQQRCEQISKVVAYLQDRITESATLDLQKEMLAYHGHFDSLDVFKQLDSDNNGYITADEFQRFFAEDEDLTDTRFDLLISYWTRGSGDRLTYNQWKDGLSSFEGQRSNGNGFQRYPKSRDEGQKSIQDNSWRQQLKFVLYLSGQYAFKASNQPEYTNDESGQQVRVLRNYTLTIPEAQNLWRHVDNYRQGSVTGQQVQRWLEDEAQFTVPQHRIHFIEDAFDTIKRDGRISEKEFISVLGGNGEDEQMDYGEEQEEEYTDPEEEEQEYNEHQQHTEPEQR